MPAIKKIIKDLTIEDPIEVFWNDAGDLDGGSDKTTAWRQYDEELAALKEIPVKTIGYFFKEKYIANRCVIPIGCITKIKRY